MDNNDIDVVISFDTTGSMQTCIAQVRREVDALTRRLFSQVPGLRIGIISHGDYCDGADVIKITDLSANQTVVSQAIRHAPNTGGGDAPECYELVLHEARKLTWTAGRSKVLVLIGDDVPHGPHEAQNTKHLNWRNEIGVLLEMGIHVYAVQALRRSHATAFYKEVAEKTGGFHLGLDQFSAINDLILAVAFKQLSPERLQSYEAEVQSGGRMTDSVGAMFDTLAGRAPRPVVTSTFDYHATTSRSSGGRGKGVAGAAGDFKVSELVPVHPSRFQVLDVPADVPIAEFVRMNGLHFNTGRGFYEFTKPVTVQSYKEVVLLHKATGKMFSGSEARRALGLPEGTDVRLSAGDLPDFIPFIQSTSPNRKLIGGTRFLYEMNDTAGM